MNIDTSGGLVRRTSSAPGAVDLTISDRGIARRRTERSPVRAEPAEENQVTSSRALQEVLSPEETRALRESFASAARVGPEPADPARLGVYSIRGTRARPQATGAVGHLVDLTG